VHRFLHFLGIRVWRTRSCSIAASKIMNELQSLKTVRAIAEAAVRELPGNFTVAAVLPGEARSAYAEVLVVREQRDEEPKRMLIGVDRDSSESEIRQAFAEKLLN
jgi:hypothetical protein